MKYLFGALLLILTFRLCPAQNIPAKADTLRKAGKLEEAILAYKAAFEESPEDQKNTYNLACAFALTYQKDSAFHYLDIALKNDSSLWVLADADMLALTTDPAWSDMENRQLKKQSADRHISNPDYAKKLLALILKDQSLNYFVHRARRLYMEQGVIPHWYYPIGAYKQQIVADNYKEMQQLIARYGWPKYSTVGKIAADAPLLIINHDESDSIRMHYLPQIKKACEEGEGSCMEYAKIQDRILVNSDRLQIYGMQFRYDTERKLEPFPIKEPELIDRRRKAIGLEPLKVYLKRKINYDWKIKQE